MPECDSSYGRQWFNFPYNFDPVWGDECTVCEKKANNKKIRKESDFEKIFNIFGH